MPHAAHGVVGDGAHGLGDARATERCERALSVVAEHVERRHRLARGAVRVHPLSIVNLPELAHVVGHVQVDHGRNEPAIAPRRALAPRDRHAPRHLAVRVVWRWQRGECLGAVEAYLRAAAVSARHRRGHAAVEQLAGHVAVVVGNEVVRAHDGVQLVLHALGREDAAQPDAVCQCVDRLLRPVDSLVVLDVGGDAVVADADFSVVVVA